MNKTKMIHNQLLQATIGDAATLANPTVIEAALEKYLYQALPGVVIISITPRITTAALNSVSAFVKFTLQGVDYDTFCKIHVESNRNELKNTGGAGIDEYQNADLIAEYGWPVNQPILQEHINPDFPIIIYKLITDPTLFDLIESSFLTGNPELTDADFKGLHEFNSTVGAACIRSTRLVPSSEAVSENTAPMQSLFYERVAEGGRITQWYTSEKIFDLPGANGKIIATPWKELLEYQWIINGTHYNSTLNHVIESTRQFLSFQGQTQAAVCVSHGDDHAGNLFLQRSNKTVEVETSVTSMDPAFAGWNPSLLSHVKSFIHNGILPAAGIYYEPNLPTCEYDISSNIINVTVDYTKAPNFDQLIKISNQITDTRIIPMLKHMSTIGLDPTYSMSQFKYALTTCCYLVIDVAKLLRERSANRSRQQRCTAGTGEGLLPLIFLCQALDQLPQLKYLSERAASVCL